MDTDITKTLDGNAPAEGEKRFTDAIAEDLLLGNDKGTVTIGGREIEVKPLNFFATKQVWKFIRGVAQPLFAARRQYNRDLGAWIAATKEDPAQTAIDMPFPQWWMEPVDKVFDDIVSLVTVVLQRTDAAISEQWVKDNLEPLPFLQSFLPVVIRQNRLDTFIKKLMASEMVQATLAKVNPSSQSASDSIESSQTSAGTTTSTSTS